MIVCVLVMVAFDSLLYFLLWLCCRKTNTLSNINYLHAHSEQYVIELDFLTIYLPMLSAVNLCKPWADPERGTGGTDPLEKS